MNTPKKIIAHLIKEFSISIFIFLLIFLSLILLLTFIQELIFFKTQSINENFYIKIFLLTLIKVPSLIILIAPFIFLFSSIFFYSKIVNNNEANSIKQSGLSNLFLSIIPSSFSFIIGILVIIIITPVSSELSKYYETYKKKFSQNENLLIFSNTGLWIKEVDKSKIYIIRSDSINDENFNNLKNATIYKFSKNYSFEERIDAKNIQIKDNLWIIEEAIIVNKNEKIEKKNHIFKSNVNIEELKNFFINSSVYSVWNALGELKKLKERGYYGQELIIIFNKYLSLPFLLFAMTSLSAIFILKSNIKFNNFFKIFLGIITGIMFYFLSDLSITLGKSGKLPLELSVWTPVIIIMTFATYSLLKED